MREFNSLWILTLKKQKENDDCLLEYLNVPEEIYENISYFGGNAVEIINFYYLFWI